jgi:hypothetical protein
MKRILVFGLAVAVMAASILMASAKRVVRIDEVLIDTMVNADSDTKLSERHALTIDGKNNDINFDEIFLGINVPNMALVSDSVVGVETAVDSVIVRLIAGTGANADTLVSVTKAALPATFNIHYAADSVGAFRKGLLNDMIWFSAYVVDSAGTGTGDSLEYTITAWWKFVERK